MVAWILVPCLVQLRTEFNLIAPNRDKRSDGSIGDDAHADNVSDHNPDETGNVPIRDVDKINEVHAIDVDKDLRVPGLTMEQVVQHILGRCRSGKEKRLRYIIYNRRIWEAKNDWRQRAYNGTNLHTEHVHFSASYVTALEANTASWHLEDLIKKPEPPKEDSMALDNTDKSFISGNPSYGLCQTQTWATGGGQHSQVGDAVLNTGYPKAPGEQRQAAWKNLQDLQTDLTEAKETLERIDTAIGGGVPAGDIAACKSMLEQLTEDPYGMTDPEQHPIIACLRWVAANPPA